jgi:pimeloyl-ACP methyl ester carboxylesterase
MKSFVAVLGVLLAASGCAKREAQAQLGDAVPVAAARPQENGAPSTRPIVYLHGMCSDPKEDLAAWGHAAEKHGTVVTVMGDVACPDKPGQLKWSTDAEAIDAKIDATLKEVADARGIRFEPGDMIVIGESMGAARAELLATKFPEKYSRLVLVGSPQTPSARNLKGAKAIATLAGENEQQTQMKAGTRALEGSGTPTRFWELPDATHGNYGPDGERIMNEAITFVASR